MQTILRVAPNTNTQTTCATANLLKHKVINLIIRSTKKGATFLSPSCSVVLMQWLLPETNSGRLTSKEKNKKLKDKKTPKNYFTILCNLFGFF